MIEDTSRMDQRRIEKRPRWRVPLVVAVGAFAVLAMVLARPSVGRWAQADRSEKLSNVRLADVLRGELVHDVAVQGRVVAASRPTLFSPSAGTVSLRVREGEEVVAGQVLAILESPELRNRLQQEQASFDALSSDLERQRLVTRRRNLENQQAVDLLGVRAAAAARELKRSEEMSRIGLINKSDLAKAQDELAIVELELAHASDKVGIERDMLAFELEDARLRRSRQQLVVDEARRNVDALRLTAPFAGQVATVSVEDRDAVVSGQALVAVVDLSELEVEVNIPEAYADDVAIGIAGVVTVDGRKYPGRLTRVAPEVRSGQVAGRVAFVDGTPPGLRQSQRLRTRLILDRRRDVLKLPRGPFLEGGGGRSAYVVVDGLASRRDIHVGVVSVTEVEVLDGLEAGDTVVLSDLARFGQAETILLTP